MTTVGERLRRRYVPCAGQVEALDRETPAERPDSAGIRGVVFWTERAHFGGSWYRGGPLRPGAGDRFMLEHGAERGPAVLVFYRRTA